MAKDVGTAIRKSSYCGVVSTLFGCFFGISSLHGSSFLPAGRTLRALPAGHKIAFMFSVCVCVCSSANITCAKLRHSVTMPL